MFTINWIFLGQAQDSNYTVEYVLHFFLTIFLDKLLRLPVYGTVSNDN